MSPRPRQKTPLPNGIRREQLPDYVYWVPDGKGRWVYRHATDGKLKSIRLGGPDATLLDLLQAHSQIVAPKQSETLQALVQAFETSRDWGELSAHTRQDYRKCANVILNTKTAQGQLVGQTRPADWSPGSVRSYLERRAEASRSRANHELRYLRRLFGWAYERDLMATNPARGVRVLKEAPRQRYVSAQEYESFMTYLSTTGYPYLIPVSELAYLCRLRLSEVLDLKRQDIREEGLYAARRKGSKDALTGWTDRLRAAVNAALALHGPIAGLYLIPSATHGRQSETTVQTAWQRSMKAWADQGNERWTIHDLKRAGISDTEGDKLAASGHRSLAMLKVYDVLPSKAPATR